MREILFRGKRVDNNTWIEGAYIPGNASGYIYIAEQHPKMVMVYRETVGQYTGMCDKNGKRIFEGDIIRGFRYRDHGQWGENEICTYAVKWKDGKSAFDPIHFFDGYTFNIKTFEVIGNIYDNPELMEET